MILVDTSVWIELFSGRIRGIGPDDLLEFTTCPPIVQEVVQGLRSGATGDAVRTAFLAIPVLSDPLPLHLYLEAADIYKEGQRKGVTIRSSVDCLIAAIAIENRMPVWHRDRDFDAIARFTSLRTKSLR